MKQNKNKKITKITSGALVLLLASGGLVYNSQAKEETVIAEGESVIVDKKETKSEKVEDLDKALEKLEADKKEEKKENKTEDSKTEEKEETPKVSEDNKEKAEKPEEISKENKEEKENKKEKSEALEEKQKEEQEIKELKAQYEKYLNQVKEYLKGSYNDEFKERVKTAIFESQYYLTDVTTKSEFEFGNKELKTLIDDSDNYRIRTEEEIFESIKSDFMKRYESSYPELVNKKYYVDKINKAKNYEDFDNIKLEMELEVVKKSYIKEIQNSPIIENKKEYIDRINKVTDYRVENDEIRNIVKEIENKYFKKSEDIWTAYVNYNKFVFRKRGKYSNDVLQVLHKKKAELDKLLEKEGLSHLIKSYDDGDGGNVYTFRLLHEFDDKDYIKLATVSDEFAKKANELNDIIVNGKINSPSEKPSSDTSSDDKKTEETPKDNPKKEETQSKESSKNKDNLANSINKIKESLKNGNWTKKSKEEADNIINNLEKLLEKDNLTKEEFTKAKEELNKIQKSVLKEDKTKNDDRKNKGKVSEGKKVITNRKNNNVKTGITSLSSILLTLTGASAGLFASKKRK